MESSVTVNTPCSAIDILPTVSNLFGLEFDSRLMSGHDVFAQNYNASQASTCMPLVTYPPTGATAGSPPPEPTTPRPAPSPPIPASPWRTTT